MPALLIRIALLLGQVWAWIVRLLPAVGAFFARFGPWLAVVWGVCQKFFGYILAKIGADTVESVLKGTAAIAIRTAVLVTWSIFLAVVMSGIYGFHIRDIAMSNPFSGFPAAFMYLVNSAFPVKFAFTLVTSYILWRFTVNQAALIMARTIKFFFGA